MTVGEIMDKQAAGAYAAGRYQFLGSTLQDVFNRGNLVVSLVILLMLLLKTNLQLYP